jgi:hypothetical protein
MGSRLNYYSQTGGDDNGAFYRKVFVNGQGPSGVAGGLTGFAGFKAFFAKADNGVKIALPPRSVVRLVVEGK